MLYHGVKCLSMRHAVKSNLFLFPVAGILLPNVLACAGVSSYAWVMFNLSIFSEGSVMSVSPVWFVVHGSNSRQFDILQDAISFAARVWNNSGGDLVRVLDVYGAVVEEFEG